MSRAGNKKKNKAYPCLDDKGMAFIFLLAALLIVGIMAGTAVELTSQKVKREREEELFFRGVAYERAIRSFYLSAPKGTPRRFPGNLEDLVSDPRFPRRKHLRCLYPEPFGNEWSLVKSPEGGIAGVASPSKEEPLRRSGFPREFAAFEQARTYSDWIFLYRPSLPVSSP